jgi:predicted nucleic acid-binding protein
LRYALDADVLIGALDHSDQHHSLARRLFTAWHERRDSVAMSVVNLSEVLIAPSSDPERLRVAREAIAALQVTIHVPTEGVGVDAARLRGRHPISLPDAYLLAAAKHSDSTVVSFDRRVLRAASTERIKVVELE